MAKSTFLTLSLLLVSAPAAAIRLSCGLEHAPAGPTYVELDTSTNTTQIVYPGTSGILDGRITRIFKAGNGTDAYNLVFNKLRRPYEGQEWEFVLHRNDGSWILFGVGYSTVSGVRHLASTKGEHAAHCVATEA